MQGDSGQQTTPLQSAQLLFCCKQIERRYGNKQVEQWTNRDYIFLSHSISKETSILISPNTLKRIFGKIHTNSHYFPQLATRDALAKFAGYANWAVMAEQMPDLGIDSRVIEKVPTPSAVARPSKIAFWWAYRKWIGGIAGLTMLVLFTFYLQKNRDDKLVPGMVRLVCQNPEGSNPHTALFKLQGNAGELPANDGFTIDFNDRKAKRSIHVNELLNHYFEMPGVYYPILYYNNVPIDTCRVSLQSGEWSATATMLSDTTRVYPISSGNVIRDGKLHVTTPVLLGAGIDTTKTFLVNFYHSAARDISGDNFSLTMKLKTSNDRPGVRCSQVWIKIFGDQYYHDVMVLKPGCTNWSTVGFSEKRFYGESSDLRSLGVDFSGGGDIRIQVKNKKAEVYANGKMIFNSIYNKSIGSIQGIAVNFSGIGTIENIALSDSREVFSSKRLKLF